MAPVLVISSLIMGVNKGEQNDVGKVGIACPVSETLNHPSRYSCSSGSCSGPNSETVIGILGLV